MLQDRLKVGHYTFIQAVEYDKINNTLMFTEIPDTFAIPGGSFATRQQIESFAKRNSYKITKE